MRLVPAVLVLCPQLGPVVQQGLTAGSVAPCQYSVVQGGQATSVFVVWRRSEGQESLERGGKDEGQRLMRTLYVTSAQRPYQQPSVIVSSDSFVERCHAISASEVQVSTALNQHPDALHRQAGLHSHRERGL